MKTNSPVYQLIQRVGAVALLALFLWLTLWQSNLASAQQPKVENSLAQGLNTPRVIWVNTVADEINLDGDCSLREAIQAANSDDFVDACLPGDGADTIFVPEGVYTLVLGGDSEDENEEGDLDVTGILTITGLSRSTTFIEAGTDTSTGIDRVFHIRPNSTLTLHGLTIQYGQIESANVPHSRGGGIYADSNSTLNVAYSTFFQNRSMDGGAIYYNSAVVNIDHTLFIYNNGNTGGGALNGSGLVTVTDSILTNNVGAFGGAINNFSGVVTLIRTTVSNNIADDFFIGGYGGAIANLDTVYLINSTVSGNTASMQGGAIRTFGEVYIQNSTIANNSSPEGGGLALLNGVVNMTNSIVATNSSSDCFITAGVMNSGDYNLDGDNSCALDQSNDITNTNPLLGPLNYNGGVNSTHLPAFNSPVLEVGDCSNGDITEDQRQMPRPQGNGCDIGSVERGGSLTVIAMDDSYEGFKNMPLLISTPGVLGNDIGLYTLTTSLITPPVHGSLSLNSKGYFIYTPSLDYVGQDEFVYIVTDGTGSDTATAVITVLETNNIPLAIPDTYTATASITLTIPAPQGVLVNDIDLDSENLLAGLVMPPPTGTLSLNGDGSLTYFAPEEFTGTVQFGYFVDDGTNRSNMALVSIHVLPYVYVETVNDTFFGIEDLPILQTDPGVLENDEGYYPLTVSLLTPPVHGVISLNPNGSFVYTPTLNYNGLDEFVYIATDGTLTATATATLAIVAVNDAPTAAADNYITSRGNVLNILAPGVLANDNDIDSASFTAVLDTDVTTGTLTLNADGSLSYEPPAEFTGVVTFTYSAFDGSHNSNPVEVTLLVVPGFKSYLPVLVREP